MNRCKAKILFPEAALSCRYICECHLIPFVQQCKGKRKDLKMANKRFKTGDSGTRYGTQRQRKRKLKVFYVVMIAIVLLAAVAVACSLLLKINTIVPVGSSVYTEADIIDACPIKTGDNLISADIETAANELPQRMPYIRSATVRRKFPSKIIVAVEPDTPVCAVRQAGVYILLDDQDKVIDLVESLPEQLTLVEGVILFEPIPGQKAQFLNEDARMIFENILSAMQGAEIDFSKINRINFTDLLSITYDYENRIRVVLGEPEDLEYKITFSRNILKNEDGNGLDSSSIGLLDLSRAANTDRGIFTPYNAFEEIDKAPEAVQPIEPENNTPEDSQEPDDSSQDENSEDGEEPENNDEEPEDDGGDEGYDEPVDYENTEDGNDDE